jgi:phage terminase large subunit-like protein
MLTPRRQWLAEFQRELLTFPTAMHDDQIDAIGRAGSFPKFLAFVTASNVCSSR